MLKSTAGGGGMGLVICNSPEEVQDKFDSTRAHAQIHPGLDIVELMFLQGIAKHDGVCDGILSPPYYDQGQYMTPLPNAGVDIPYAEWLRVDSWVETGTTITPYFDLLACKLIVTGSTWGKAIDRLCDALQKTKIYRSPNNISYLQAICQSDGFRAGKATTTFLDTFAYTARACEVLSGASRRQYRTTRVVVSVWASHAVVRWTGSPFESSSLPLPCCGRNQWRHHEGHPEWNEGRLLGDTKVVLGLQGHIHEPWRVPGPLSHRRRLTIAECDVMNTRHASETLFRLPDCHISTFPSDWMIYVLPGPQCDSSFITPDGVTEFFNTRWSVSVSSNWMGVRLDGPRIAWARETGGEGGSHPSNILVNGYDVNGDTPVILTHEGPDMGGYVGDSAILVEFGKMQLDFAVQVRIHAFEAEVRRRVIPGIWFLAPCIRSTMVHFNFLVISQSDVLSVLIDAETLPSSVDLLTFPGVVA
ncbi:biotin carboxylase C-terminal domain-containing protein [Fomes fomentarius]|nr:biotin carboxylase C-terminal domain-containing protein [Fomes fomentarius]